MDALPLVDALAEHGYETYGVSGNGFANQRNGFDTSFDEFTYTAGWGPFQEGLNITEFAYELRGRRDTITSKEIAKVSSVDHILRIERPASETSDDQLTEA